MAMSEGSVTVDPVTAVVTGSGAAKDVFDALDAGTSYPMTLTLSAKAAAREQLANLARAVAKIIPHIVAHAVVDVASGIPVSSTVTGGTASGSTTSDGTGLIS